MSVTLATIKERFNSFRAKSPGKVGKQLRYPLDLQNLLLAAKDEHSYKELAEASGLSEGGLNKMVDRLRKGTGGKRKVGRPVKETAATPKASRSTIKMVKGGKKKTKPTKQKMKTSKAKTTKTSAKATKTSAKAARTKMKVVSEGKSNLPSVFSSLGKKRGRPRLNPTPLHFTLKKGKEKWDFTMDARDVVVVLKTLSGAA